MKYDNITEGTYGGPVPRDELIQRTRQETAREIFEEIDRLEFN